jgi:CheY-like chemotaxis protein
MQTLLRGWGAEVIAVSDADAAMAAAKKLAAQGRVVSGLLVDYHLDLGDGITAIADFRSAFGSDIPAVLITADRTPAVRDEARLNRIAVLNKPLKPASLRALVGQWRRRRLEAAE